MTDKSTCPKCGSEKVRQNHYWDLKDGKKIWLDECQDCGHVFETKEEMKE